VLVIAGTGSIAYGMNERGESARAGGWGSIVSDQGSAFWIGREAVAATLRSYDLGGRNGMFAIIATSWKASTPEEMVRIANSGVLAKFSELATSIADAAELGNPSAKSIMMQAGQELAALAGIVIARLWPQGGVMQVASSGGVLHGSSLVQRGFQDALQADYPKAVVSFAQVRPVLGALAMAAAEGSFTREVSE
jgi:N-acetylglucosamine kinase-like BadF-type ATPase